MKKGILKIITIIIISCTLLPSVFQFIVQADTYYSAPDFYVIVSSVEGEINYRSGAGIENKVLCMIPNGTVLHITDILYHPADGFFWGQANYNGYSDGWVSIRQTTILRENGYYAPDYYAVVSADGGTLNLRSGAGINYYAYMQIPNGQQLHITDMIYNPDDGFFWGLTSYSGFTGYVSLRQTTVMRGYSISPSADTYINMPVNDKGIDTKIIGNWEYGFTQFDVQFSFYKDGYCFYEDGTGLDVFWNEPFTYWTKDGLVGITYNNPEYPSEIIPYSFEHMNQINGIVSENGFDFIILEHESGACMFFHMPDDVFYKAEIVADQTESWDNNWLITTEDGVNVTIKNSSYYFGYDDKNRIVPNIINGHKVRTVNSAVNIGEQLNYVIVSDGIEIIGNEAFANAKIDYLYLPKTLMYMADDAFSHMDFYSDYINSLMLLVHEGSYAEKYAKEHNLKYQIIPDIVEDIEKYISDTFLASEIDSNDLNNIKSHLEGYWVGPATGFEMEITSTTIITRDYYMGTGPGVWDIFDEQTYSYTIKPLDSGNGYLIEGTNMQDGTVFERYYYNDEPGKLYPENPMFPYDYWSKLN